MINMIIILNPKFFKRKKKISNNLTMKIIILFSGKSKNKILVIPVLSLIKITKKIKKWSIRI